MSRKALVILLLVLGTVAAAASGTAYYYVYGPGAGDSATSTAGGYQIVPADRTMGNKNAKVVLIEYAAHTCPHCAAFNEQIFPQIKQKYIDTGKVFYVFRLFPIDPTDGAVEKMARCLPEDKYFAFVDLMFRNQSKWDPHIGVTDVHGGLIQMGRIAGMSAEQVDTCIENKAEDDRINKTTTEAQLRYGITGTPTIIINGTNAGMGGGSAEALGKLLDTELAK